MIQNLNKTNFKKQLVDMANDFGENCDARAVNEAIESSDVVFGVYQDVTENHGVGFVIIKGELEVENIVNSKVERDMVTTAIPCRNGEEAWALRKVYGDSKSSN